MKRSWQIWIGFTACLAVVLAAMGWMSVTAIRLDEAETRMREQAALEEDVRLALWRMDTQLWSVVSQETARPYFAYSAMYSADRASAWRFDPLQQKVAPVASDVLIPSPLLSQTPPHRKLYFQYQYPQGEGPAADPLLCTSPQVPGERWQAHLDGSMLPPARLDEYERRLAEFQQRMDVAKLAAAIPEETAVPEEPASVPAPVQTPSVTLPPLVSQPVMPRPDPLGPPQTETPPQQAAAPQPSLSPPLQPGSQPTPSQQAGTQFDPPRQQGRTSPYSQPNAPGFGGQGSQSIHAQQQAAPNPQLGMLNRSRNSIEQQRELSNMEYNARFQGYQQLAVDNSLNGNPFLPLADDVKTGVMWPVWMGQELILARWVEVGAVRYLQGVWLDWPGLKQELLAAVGDLFPMASLKPAALPNGERPERLLSVAPVEFAPGRSMFVEFESWSPVRVSLAVAWACVLLAGVAVAALLAGVMRLSERRASFVSAVTHELRTPLTTFRMYADMLVEGMVPDEARRQKYLGTLRTEADRLGHLVENVLAYAKLERGRQRRTPQRARVDDLISQWQGRLQDRAARDGMELQTNVSPAVAEKWLKTDASAVEQILFNLVDNACKYAQGMPRLIHLEAELNGNSLQLRVRDHGPGIPAREGKRLFRPFHKSARDAAHSAPGVGLGLSLSRRLARDLGGNLQYDSHSADGALFVLTLPLCE